MSIEVLITYLFAITILTITPGLDTMVVIRNSVRGGVADGVVTSTGICSGLLVHALVSALGISVLLMQAAWAFSALKIAGACYLIWLGICSLRALSTNQSMMTESPSTEKVPFVFARSFREGFLSNVLNPKTAVFYLAFLPQFIDPNAFVLGQTLMLAGLHFVIAMIWQCSVVMLVNKIRLWLFKPRVAKAFNGVTGAVFMLMGMRLMLEK